MDYYGTSMPYIPDYYDFEFLGFLGIAFFFILFVIFVFSIISYIFSAIGLYTMAKKRNLSHPWMAWIPILDLHLQGQLVNDDISIGSWHIPYAKLFLPLFPIVLGLLGSLFWSFSSFGGSFLLFVLYLGFVFYNAVSLFWLFSIYSPQNRIVFLVLSILFPFLSSIFIFAIRNNDAFDPRYPEGAPEENYDSKSILSLTLGISSFFAGIFYVSITGIIVSTIALREKKALGEPHGMALAGLICSIANIVLKLLLGILILITSILSISSLPFLY